jgi:pimeloyl-ACP methyl ester carboxylesterase
MRRTFLWLGWSAAFVGGLLVLALTGILVVLHQGLTSFGITLPEAYSVLRAQEADASAIHSAEGPVHTPNGIAERGFVQIGGIKQWVTIRGTDRRNPVILILHGGPGDAYSQLAYFFRNWESTFTVVQWDQRGAGRTYELYGGATPDMTLDRLIEDGAEVSNYARRRLDQPKIVLLGHSWGSALGVYLITRHPELFCAFVGTGQIVRTVDLSARYYTYTLTRLTTDHQVEAIAELRRLGPPPYRTVGEEETVRKWLNHYLEDDDKHYLLTSTYVALRSPQYSLKDFRELQEGHLSFSLPVLDRTYQAIDLNTLGYTLSVPFFIIDGRSDRLTPPDLVSAFFQKVHAPEKTMLLIDGGHFAMMSNPDEFLRLLLNRVTLNAACVPKYRSIRGR